MKKKKITALVLAGMLLVGGTFAGTKALFMDSEKLVTELSISTGDVDFEVVQAGKWTVSRVGNEKEYAEGTEVNNENESLEDSNSKKGYAHTPRTVIGEDQISKDVNNEKGKTNVFINNLKPGDTFKKVIKLRNVGTLNAIKATLLNPENLNEKDLVIVGEPKMYLENARGENVKEIDENTIIKPQELVRIELEYKINPEAGGKHNESGYNSDAKEDTIINLNKTFEFTATQQTAQK